MPTIGAALVAKIKPDGTERFIWDDELAGFGLRIRASGSAMFVCQYKIGGRTRRITLGRPAVVKPEEARRQAKAILGDVARGMDPAEVRDARKADITIAELCDLYLKDGAAGLKPSSKEAVTRAFDCHVKPLLGRRKLASLTVGDVDRMQADIATGKTATDEKSDKARGRRIVKGGKGAASRAVAYFRMALAFAVRRGLRPDNPASGIKLFATDHRERFLSPAELAKLGEALTAAEQAGEHPRFIAAIRLLLLTGARKQEILRLRWSEVDIEGGRLRLDDSKTGRKVISLGAPALAILAGLVPPDEEELPEFVLPALRGKGPLVGLQSAWERIRSKAKLDAVRIHDLRPAFASVAVAAGESLYLTGKLLGHSRPETSARYAHLGDDPLKAAADRVSQRVAAALAGPKKKGEVVELAEKRAG